MFDKNFLYDMRRDLKSQAEGLKIQRAAILSQIAVIEKQLGIEGDKNVRRNEFAKSVIAKGSECITENSEGIEVNR